MTSISGNGWFAATRLIKEQLHNKLNAHHITKPKQIHTGEGTIKLRIRFYEFNTKINKGVLIT